MIFDKLLLLLVWVGILQSMQQNFPPRRRLSDPELFKKNLFEKNCNLGTRHTFHYSKKLFFNDTKISEIFFDIKEAGNGEITGYIKKLFLNPDYTGREIEKLSVIYAVLSMHNAFPEELKNWGRNLCVKWHKSFPELDKKFFDDLGFEPGQTLVFDSDARDRFNTLRYKIEYKNDFTN